MNREIQMQLEHDRTFRGVVEVYDRRDGREEFGCSRREERVSAGFALKADGRVRKRIEKVRQRVFFPVVGSCFRVQRLK